MARPVAVRLSPSTSPALASSSAWVISRAPLSSAIGVSVTGDGRRCVVDRRDVERRAAGHRVGAVGDRVAEADRGVVVQRRGVGPGAVAVVDQRARTGADRQAGGRQAVAVDVDWHWPAARPG